MTLYEKVQLLCQKEGFAISNLGERIPGLPRATISGWARGSVPRPEKLKAIADYFGVDVSYLTSEDSAASSNDWLPDDPVEEIIIKAYRQADAAGKARIIQVAMNESDRSQNASHPVYRAAKSVNHSEPRIEKRTAEEMAKFKTAPPITSDDDL